LDTREIVIAIKKEHPDWSYAQIGQKAGCCRSLVQYHLYEKTRLRHHANGQIKKQRSHQLKKEIIKEMGGKCQYCGYDKFAGALEFHHIDATTKDFTISNLLRCNSEKIREEVKKCALLCSNCHKELHAGIINLN
jgi:5-methylcytosine-specific restriction endonuclease McrA